MKQITKKQIDPIKNSAQFINKCLESVAVKHKAIPSVSSNNNTMTPLSSRSLSTSSSDMSLEEPDAFPSPIILSSTYQEEFTQHIFECKDFLSYLLGFLSPKDRANLLLINKSIRPLINQHLRAKLTVLDLNTLRPTSKLYFSIFYALRTKIQILPEQNIEDLYFFLTNPSNQAFLNSIESLQFHDVNSQNILIIQNILNLISSNHIKLPSLISLSFRDIWENLYISKLPHRLSIHCGDIYAEFRLSDLDLIDLSCRSIFQYLIISKFKNLQSFTCKTIQSNKKLTLSELPSLTSITCLFAKDNASILLQNLPKLQLITFQSFEQTAQVISNSKYNSLTLRKIL